MGRRPCCSKDEDMNKGAWTAMEDKILTDYIKVHGEGKWRNLPKKAGLKRCGKSCRLRWLNYLRPDIKRGNISHDEEELIVRLHKLLGNRWSLIAGRLPGRTDNEIKNYWNTNFGKKVTQITTPNTSNHKPSNQSKEKPNATMSEQPSPNTEQFVVRTKATRCTKVFTQPEPQTNAQANTSPVGVGPSSAMVLKDKQLVVNNQSSSEPLLPFLSEEEYNPPSDFLMNLEMDDRFLSDLLNTDLSQFCGFDDDGLQAADHNKNSTSDHGSLLSSPNSDDPTLLLSEENLHDTDVQLMASLLDSELNWF